MRGKESASAAQRHREGGPTTCDGQGVVCRGSPIVTVGAEVLMKSHSNANRG